MLKAAVIGMYVLLNWSASPQPIGVTIQSYLVMRSVNNGAYQQIATPSSLTWSDTGVKRNRTYCYKVQTKDTRGDVSAATPPVCVRP